MDPQAGSERALDELCLGAGTVSRQRSVESADDAQRVERPGLEGERPERLPAVDPRFAHRVAPLAPHLGDSADPQPPHHPSDAAASGVAQQRRLASEGQARSSLVATGEDEALRRRAVDADGATEPQRVDVASEQLLGEDLGLLLDSPACARDHHRAPGVRAVGVDREAAVADLAVAGPLAAKLHLRADPGSPAGAHRQAQLVLRPPGGADRAERVVERARAGAEREQALVVARVERQLGHDSIVGANAQAGAAALLRLATELLGKGERGEAALGRQREPVERQGRPQDRVASADGRGPEGIARIGAEPIVGEERERHLADLGPGTSAELPSARERGVRRVAEARLAQSHPDLAAVVLLGERGAQPERVRRAGRPQLRLCDEKGEPARVRKAEAAGRARQEERAFAPGRLGHQREGAHPALRVGRVEAIARGLLIEAALVDHRGEDADRLLPPGARPGADHPASRRAGRAELVVGEEHRLRALERGGEQRSETRAHRQRPREEDSPARIVDVVVDVAQQRALLERQTAEPVADLDAQLLGARNHRRVAQIEDRAAGPRELVVRGGGVRPPVVRGRR